MKAKVIGYIDPVSQNEYNEMHKRLGCYNCKRCDMKSLGKAPCCTYSGQLEIDSFGSCLKKVAVA